MLRIGIPRDTFFEVSLVGVTAKKPKGQWDSSL